MRGLALPEDGPRLFLTSTMNGLLWGLMCARFKEIFDLAATKGSSNIGYAAGDFVHGCKRMFHLISTNHLNDDLPKLCSG